MEDANAEDEKKPFDAEGQDGEEALPDPDEDLVLDKGNGRVWVVKIPKHLMQRWRNVTAEDVHLATIRVYDHAVSPTGKSPRIFLFLPPDPNDPTPRDPNLPAFDSNAAFFSGGEGGGQHVDRYELEMVNSEVDNQLVVAERPKEPPPPSAGRPHNPRARTTIVTGRIRHECSLRPIFNDSYRKHMRERTRVYNTPQRQIRMIEEAGVSGGRGGINRLSSGVNNTGSFSDLVRSKNRPPKGAFERMARMPRNQLLDMLFSLFREQPRWPIKGLRERTQQPEVYLKEILNEIASLHRSGEHNGLWELSEVFKTDGIKAENVPLPSGSQADVKMDDYDEDEDDDEDEDMEEVS